MEREADSQLRSGPQLCAYEIGHRETSVYREQLIEIYNTKKEHHMNMKNKLNKKIFILKHDKFIRIFFSILPMGCWRC